MDLTGLQDDEVGQLQELSCPYLAKLHPALVASKLAQEKLRAFGNKTVVLHGQPKLLLACFNLRHVVPALVHYGAGSILRVASSALQPAMELRCTWPTSQTAACWWWLSRSVASIWHNSHQQCAALVLHMLLQKYRQLDQVICCHNCWLVHTPLLPADE